MLEKLLETGWSIGSSEPLDHTQDSERCLNASGFIRRKRFLQCLLALENLFSKGLCSLRRGQCATYYSAVLHSDMPATVPIDKPAAFYKTLLEGKDFDDSDAEPPELDSVAKPEPKKALAKKRAKPSVTVDISLGESDITSLLRPAKKARVSSGVLEVPTATADSSVPPPQMIPSVAASSSSGPPAAPATSSSACASAPPVPVSPLPSNSCSAGAAVPGPPAPAVPPPVPPALAAVAPDGLPFPLQNGYVYPLLNSCIKVEVSEGTIRQKDTYTRLVALCPLAGTLHKCGHGKKNVCQKKRNFGPTQCRLGPFEPLAYLGVWIKEASQCDSNTSHIHYTPTKEKILAFMKEMGWPVAH